MPVKIRAIIINTKRPLESLLQAVFDFNIEICSKMGVDKFTKWKTIYSQMFYLRKI